MGALSSISDLIPQVLLVCPGVPANMVPDAMKNALLEFFQESEIWTEEIDLTTVEDQAAYSLTPTTSGAEAERIDRVRYLNDDGDETDDLPAFACYLDESAGKLTFNTAYIPSDDDLTVRVRTILRPQWRAADTYYPTWVLKRFGRQIVNGTAAILMDMPDRPYTNPRQAAKLRSSFVHGIGAAKDEVARRGTQYRPGFRP